MKKLPLFLLRIFLIVSTLIAAISGLLLIAPIIPLWASLTNQDSILANPWDIYTVLMISFYLSAGVTILFAGFLTIKDEQNSMKNCAQEGGE